MRMIKVIRIDPFLKTVSQVQYDASDYRNLYPVLSSPEHPVDIFTAVYPDGLAAGDALFVDDEGLFKGVSQFFSISGFAQPISGCAAIIGSNEEGDSVDCKTTLETVRSKVSFVGELDGGDIMAANPPRIVQF